MNVGKYVENDTDAKANDIITIIEYVQLSAQNLDYKRKFLN